MTAEILQKPTLPWSGIGKDISNCQSLEGAIKVSGLDWEAVRKENQTRFRGTYLKTDSHSILRVTPEDARVISTVGASYEPVQNARAFEFFEPLINSGKVQLETAGEIGGGKRVWVLGRINQDPDVIIGDDEVNRYIMFGNAHDGSMCIHVGYVPIRVSCINMLGTLKGHQSTRLIKIRHNASVHDNIDRVQEIMNNADDDFQKTMEAYRTLAHKQITVSQLEELVKTTFSPPPKVNKATGLIEAVTYDKKVIVSKVVQLFEESETNNTPEIKGSFWAAYNAVTEFTTWQQARKPERRFSNTVTGKVNDRALYNALMIAA